jgi:hypothetical protein
LGKEVDDFRFNILQIREEGLESMMEAFGFPVAVVGLLP